MTHQNKKYLTTADLQARFAISEVTVWRWTRVGKLPRPLYVNGRKRWAAEEIIAAEERMFDDSFVGAGATATQE